MDYYVIKNCPYEIFESIRDQIFVLMPFALTFQAYAGKLKWAVFGFNDSKYVPIWMAKHAAKVPHFQQALKALKDMEDPFAP